ncbi:5'-nucleotidase [Gammaproteobacteria bacterium]|nr:5'-nucleotidase [Gammaproteobacteria bacterium]
MSAALPARPAARFWRECDTVLLDMDGTLLDLSFDNWFWREAVPRCLARASGGPAPEVRERLFAHFARKQGSLDWYCLDYWTRELGLDLRALKEASSHRIRYLPGAREFLQQARVSGKRLVLVTNAHAETLEVKQGVSGLGRFFEACVSSHALGSPKEAADFWPRLQAVIGFDPARTLFVDDSLPVLDAAANFGIAGVVGVSRPDSRAPARPVERHHSVEGVAGLLEA